MLLLFAFFFRLHEAGGKFSDGLPAFLKPWERATFHQYSARLGSLSTPVPL